MSSKFLPRGFSNKIFNPFSIANKAGAIRICSGVAILIASNFSVLIRLSNSLYALHLNLFAILFTFSLSMSHTAINSLFGFLKKDSA